MPTLNGKDLLTATIQEPLIGYWTATVEVDSEAAITGAVSMEIDGVTWVGTVMSGDSYAGRAHAQIVGGAGKLATELDAKYYLGVPLAVVLSDLSAGTGEKLSATIDSAVRNHSVARWSRPQGKASLALKQVADEVSASYRALRDGTLWLGAETWPTVAPKYDEIDKQPGRGSMTIAPDSPTVAPGTAFAGKRVSRVTTTLSPEGLRQDIVFESAAATTDVAEHIASIVLAQVDNTLDYSRMYACKVVHQDGDDTLAIIPDDLKMRGNGLTKVPIRHGIPGVKVTVPSGGKVLLFFEDGDPKKPACALWPTGASVTQINITAPTIIIDGDLQVTGEVTARSQSAPVTLSQHRHPDAMGGTQSPLPGT